MQHSLIRVCSIGVFLLLYVFCVPLFAQNLEIHYINVGWGSSVLIKGPTGTTVLIDAGNTGMGTNEVVPYLQSIGIPPATGLDYTIVTHQHCDHDGGMDEVVNAGYNVHTKNYYNGSTYSSSCVTGWNSAAATTTAGAPVVMPVGTQIPLGSGAILTCVACNGNIIGGGTASMYDENDASIVVLVQYGGFDYLCGGDLGGGSIDNACTGRSTSQSDIETPVIQAISPGGAHPMISAGGIDVLHVNHHGSESSTNMNWMNYSKPALAVISVGAGQTSGWDLPRIDVVEHVLLAQATSCITAPPAVVLQTEEGSPAGSLTSYAGYCCGNIKIQTDGVSTFTVSADGHVHTGPDERVAAGLPRTFNIDDAVAPPDTIPPIISNVLSSNITTTTALITWTTDEASSSVVEYGLTASYGSTTTGTGGVTSHSVTLSGLTAGTVYHYRVKSADAAGNTATSVDHSFQTGSTYSYAPTGTTITSGSLKSGSYTNLAANDGSYYIVNSTTSGTRKCDWYSSVTVPQAPSSITKLTVTYDGKYSRSRTQYLYLYNWSSSSWTQVDSRTVSTTDVTVTNTQTSPGNFISLSGQIRLRVYTSGGSTNYPCSGDYVQFNVETCGQSLSRGVAEQELPVQPVEYRLAQNYPNPFNPSTIIRYSLRVSGHVSLKVYDVLGQEVAALVDEIKEPGEYSVMWDASDVPSGVYFCRFDAPSAFQHDRVFTQIRKMMLLK